MNLEGYHDRLRILPCVVCVILREAPIGKCEELHHAGNAEDRNDWAVVPLCHRHHQGVDGIHELRRRGFFKATQISDVRLLAETARLVAWNFIR